jgi:diaminopimelate decarboxylase
LAPKKWTACNCLLSVRPLASGAVKRPLGFLKRLSTESLKKLLRRAVVAATPSDAGIASEHWGLDISASGNLSLAGVDLAQLATDHGSPLHVVDGARLRRNAERFLAVPPGARVGCEVYYSYKTNPVPGMLAELHRSGIGAEVISHYELWLALRLGVAPSRIVYNGPVKSDASVRLAIEQGIGLLNINHREEIAQVARIASELGRKPRIALRVAGLGGWTGQFGTPAANGQALAAYQEAVATGVLDVVGLHAHRGGMIRTESELASFAHAVLGFADTLRERLGLRLDVLDFGGSLGSPSVRALHERELRLNRTLLKNLQAPRPESALSIEAYISLLVGLVTRHYEAISETPPRVFLEPGRALTSDTQFLLTRVAGLKPGAETVFAICDAGINLAESCRSEYHQFLRVNGRRRSSTQTYTIVGPICTPGDTLRWAVRLPRLAVGDTLAIMDAGAYFVPFSTSFSFPRPGVVMIDGGQVAQLRRAESFEDLTRLDVVVGPLLTQ